MGFWSSIKDVLVSGPTAAAKNERAENAAEKAAEEAAKKPAPAPAPSPKTAPKADAPVKVPPASAPQPPVEVPAVEETEPEYRTYTVKSGDTLSEIAASYGVDWHEMAELNNLDNPDLIFPGQVFKVPN